MENLPLEKQTEIKKMSSERLATYLVRAGYDEEGVFNMDRSELLNAWAECVAAGRDNPPETQSTATPTNIAPVRDWDFHKQMLEFEMLKYREEREERKRREEFEKQKYEMEWRIRQQQLEEEKELRLREIKLKEEELARLAKRDKEESEKKNRSLVGPSSLGRP